ncbi:hypothetical protein L226DRAFT_573135 [Lentinus tigrinus ALCF2SS1-7]|uniref:uncharacterized protein n=1 Tax=Lentinus tigrinus ALCF2SS1-7 TaxID=1328758 RepID=UPI001165FAE5|nr:hypothetical protein L226DRAFT_573135 [Lentinus tigrinus ALCF2SS1-7]
MSSGTRTSFVGVRYALDKMQDKVLGIQDADTDAEKALVDVLLRLSLAGPEETWLRDFSARSSALNKEHRHTIKQALNDTGMLISFLYGNIVVERLRSMANVFTGRQNALKQLELAVAEMSQCCRTAVSLHSRVEVMYAARIRGCFTFAQQNVMLPRTMDNVRLGIHKLRSEEATILALFERWKPCFIVICQKTYHRQALDAIHANKIDQDTFAELAGPILANLTSLCHARERLVSEVGSISATQVKDWVKRSTGVLRKTELEEALGKYDVYVEKINLAKNKQARVLAELLALDRRCKRSPTTFPGPDGTEIQVDDLRSAFRQFENVRFCSMRLIKLANKLIKDLRALSL